ncbi:hypothetical protein CO165_05255 [Candidatus Roizmanbacteria bacterium CG_4_9_14_3_um_filter_33_18]|uniref:Uncharacterized protein n=1 Tax=Candidatus Roizmanbacteria bacterium CG_4_9_14_3_um_filter_33_18 TaxID=1974841 RepID=A0A2M7XWM9_9BACT|nr:MAG: hypothetical protein CO165_05255 [Candidatus Roizmanbacteria bacterium CG_4_9_14_3_um_filter_33_18]
MNNQLEKTAISIPGQVNFNSVAKSIKNTGRLDLCPTTYEQIRHELGQDGVNRIYDLVQILKAILRIK